MLAYISRSTGNSALLIGRGNLYFKFQKLIDLNQIKDAFVTHSRERSV